MSKIALISNLFPRPDEPRRGLFNLRFAEALGCVSSVAVPVMEWRLWRWAAIRQWRSPVDLPATYYPVFYVPRLGRNAMARACERALQGSLPALRQADACLATWLYPDGVATASLARTAGIPCWLKAHGTDRFHLENPQRGAQLRQALQHCEGIITNGEFLKRELIRLGVANPPLHVIPHGVDRMVFNHLSPTPPRRRTILCVGNLKPIKGVDRVYEAFASLAQDDAMKDVELEFIGRGPLQASLTAAASRAGLGERVHFAGTLSPAEVAKAMNSASMLCLGSRSEGMPNVVLEALACGLPVLSTDVGDVPTLVTESHGVVVENQAADVTRAFTESMRSILAHPWDRAAMAAAAPVRSWEACGREARSLILGEKAGPS